MFGKIAIISLLILGFAYYLRSGSKVIKDGKVIKTNTGPVRGSILTSRDGKDYFAWHRIPYAKPPVGNLRFADPQPIDEWTDVIDGREIGPECAQVDNLGFGSSDIYGNEDCLHLNVFTPKKLHEDTIQGKRAKLPVLVWIHGGGYVLGSGKLGSPRYFMDEDVVYVTLNYRLDILGFLTTGDKIVRGNQGLKDQTMALKWIKKNIEHFGGDANQVTIFGTSAGGASVHQQMLSPLSKGLFQRVFAQSGAASNSWGLITLEKSIAKTKETAETLDCPSNDNQKLVDCLRKMDVNTLLRARVRPLKEEYQVNHPHKCGSGFVPIVEAVKDEEAFLTEHPLIITAKGKAHKVPLLIGHTTHEGLMITAAFRRNTKNLEEFEAKFVPAVKSLFDIENSNADETAKQIYNYYIPNAKEMSLDDKIERYVDMFGDAFFNYDIRETIRIQRKFSPVYYYLHNKTDVPDFYWFLTEFSGEWPLLMELGWYFLKTFVKESILGIVPPFKGVNHAVDLMFYFSMEEMGTVINQDSRLYQYSKDLLKMLTQFVKSDKMEFRGVQIIPTPSEGPLTLAEFKNEEVIYSPEPFLSRMEFLSSLKIRP